MGYFDFMHFFPEMKREKCRLMVDFIKSFGINNCFKKQRPTVHNPDSLNHNNNPLSSIIYIIQAK